MRAFESIVVLGSSGSGKTTLVNGLRSPGREKDLVIPGRFITRPRRERDDTLENTHTDWHEFWSMVNRGILDPHWNRTLESGRQEGYAFERVKKDDGRLRVYSANNAFLRNPNHSVRSMMETALVVAVTADIETRDKRLAERSPDISDAERAVRLADDGADLLGYLGPVEVIDTTKLGPDEGHLALSGIVEAVIAG